MIEKRFGIPASICVILGLVSFFALPWLLFGHLDAARGMTYALLLPMCATAGFTGWFMLTSLREFKTSSRRAYYIICAGIFLLILSQVEQAAATLLYELFPEFIKSFSALIGLLFIVLFASSMLALYIGVRKLAKLLNVKTIGHSTVFAVLISLGLSGLLFFLPWAPSGDNQTGLILVMVTVITFSIGLTLAAALVATKVKDAIGSAYRAPMGWLALGLGVLAGAILQEIIFKATLLASSAYVQYSLDLLPCLLATFLFMKAGHAFKVATFRQLPTNATYVDAIVYVADLVSDKKMIDPILDDMRKITANLGGETALGEAQKKVLFGVYLRLEEHLLTKEALREFTKASLRGRLSDEFQRSLEQLEGKSSAPAPNLA